MAWFIALFYSDQSVSLVSEKWMKKNGKKCYFPKTKVASKIKKEAEVDKKSTQWGLYPCRILMNGTKFQTYSDARNAEAIAQNHSTMASFEASYTEKRKSRKHPKVFSSSSDSDHECDDLKNIAALTKLDSESIATTEKVYAYVDDDCASKNGDSNVSSADESVSGDSEREEGQDSENDYNESVTGSGNENGSKHFSESDSNCGNYVNETGYESVNGDNDSERDNGQDPENDDSESAIGSCDENISEHFSEADSNCGNYVETGYDAFEGHDSGRNALPNSNNLESTAELRSPAAEYDFSDDRRLLRVEKLLMHVCRELDTLKTDIKALKTTSKDTEGVIEKFVAVCKDLSVEVFSCTSEFKKRNGMFSDLLVPDLKLPVTRRKHYNRNELAMVNNKISDNMIKYLGSTINESNEKRFIESCFEAVFGIEFLVNKVWWKREPKKVLIKNSKILHCIKETFLMKFGLAEPKKTIKQIERLIYKTHRNLKDKYRKSLLKKKNSGNDEDLTCDESDQVKKKIKPAEELKRKGKRSAKKAKGVAEVDGSESSYDIRDDAPIPKRRKKRYSETEDENSDCIVAARRAEEAKLTVKQHKRIDGKAKRERKESKRATKADQVESSDEIRDDVRTSKRGKKRLTIVDDEDSECNVASRKVEEVEPAAAYKRIVCKTKRAAEKARSAVELGENESSDEIRNGAPMTKRGKKRLIISEDDDSECVVVVKKRKAKKTSNF